MALQSEVSPSIVGDPNKVTQIDGDTKSEDEEDSTEDEDMEEGEIQDSGGEEEEKEKDLTKSSLKDALDKSCLQSIEELLKSAKNATENVMNPSHSSVPQLSMPPKSRHRYRDVDQADESDPDERGWRTPSPKRKRESKSIDYRMELATYRGTPPSSPDSGKKDRKKRSKKSKRKSIRRKDKRGNQVRYRDSSKICKFFKEGKCAKGSDCNYSHSNPVERPKKKELCKFYLNGHCNKDKHCIFMHGEFPCKFYHTGSECYAKDDCRFSHKPLTNEMTQVLKDYLRITHGDRDNEDLFRPSRGRRRSRSPSPPPKSRPLPVQREPSPPSRPRPCLLGSPPRHIREAEETKRWQEEMKAQLHPSFEIKIGDDVEGGQSPMHFPKPNFYQETLPGTPSPQKRRTDLSHNEVFPPYNQPSSPENYEHINNDETSKVYVYDEEEFSGVTSAPVKPEPDAEDFIWDAIPADNHTHEHNAKPFAESLQHEPDFTSDVKFDETTQFSEMGNSEDASISQSPDRSSNHDVITLGDSPSHEEQDTKQEEKSHDDNIQNPRIVVPSHLPRKQRELFLRVQQHQKKNANITDQTTAAGSPKVADSAPQEELPQVKEEVLDREANSNDSKWYSSEEDDEDESQPLTDILKKIQQAPPPPLAPGPPKPALSLMQMLQKIQQNATEKQQKKPDSFLTSLMGGLTLPSPAPVSPAHPSAEAKRRTLLPNPLPLPTDAVVKDPRLKNRDPRTKTAVPPPVAAAPQPSVEAPPAQTTKLLAEPIKEIQYRLHSIVGKSPNYTPFILSSHGNPNLYKDPRLRRYLQSSDSDKEIDEKSALPKSVPPIPELLLKYEKHEAINIFESSSSKKKVKESKPPTFVPTNTSSLIASPADYVPDKPVASYLPQTSTHLPKVSLDSILGIKKPVAYTINSSCSREPIASDDDGPKLVIDSPPNRKISIDSASDMESTDEVHIIPEIKGLPTPFVDYSPITKSASLKPSVDYAPITTLHSPIPTAEYALNIKPFKPIVDYASTIASFPKLSSDTSMVAKAPTNLLPDPLPAEKPTISLPSNKESKLSLDLPNKAICKPTEDSSSPKTLPKTDTNTSSNKSISKIDNSVSANSLPKTNDPANSMSLPKLTELKPLPKATSNSSSSKPVSKTPANSSNTKDKTPKACDDSLKSKPLLKAANSASNKPLPKPATETNTKSLPTSGSNKTSQKVVAELPKRKAPSKAASEALKRKPPSKQVEKSPSNASKPSTTDSVASKSTRSDSKSIKSPPTAATLCPSPVAEPKLLPPTRKTADLKRKKRGSRSNSGSDTPPRLTLADNSTPPCLLSETAPVLEGIEAGKKNLQPPLLEDDVVPPTLEKNTSVPAKKEAGSDSESSHDPPELEASDTNKSSENTPKITTTTEDKSISPEKETPPKLAKSPKSGHKKCASPRGESHKKSSRRKSSSLERQVIFTAEIAPIDTSSERPLIVPPIIIKKVKPTPASHLPKAISDPRMAKLHNPSKQRSNPDAKINVETKTPLTDGARKSRRCTRSSVNYTEIDVETDEEIEALLVPVKSTPKKQKLEDSKQSPTEITIAVDKEKKKPRGSPRKRKSAADKAVKDVSPEPEVEQSKQITKSPKKKKVNDAIDPEEHEESVSEETKEEKPFGGKSIPKKRRLSNKEEKKKTVYRNRKSSMDYASPLHSCNESDPTKESNYNSYNQRKKKASAQSSTENISAPENSNPSTSDFVMSENSNLESDNSSDVNLKDKFKTIDPTASPFC